MGRNGAADFLPATPSLSAARAAAAGCRGCGLYRRATQTVFGEGAANARHRYRRAAADYQSAIDVSGDDDRRAFFSSMRAFAFTRVGDLAKADEAYRLAVQLARDQAAKDGYERSRQALTAPPPAP